MSLIASAKHTKDDLAFWKELERADKAHANSSTLRRNWDRAVDVAREFTETEDCHCATSWGKDSVVTAFAILTVAPKTPLCWIRAEPVKSPECELVRDAFLKMFPNANYHEIEVWCKHDEDGWHATGTLETGAETCRQRHGRRTILGIRADESAHRCLSIFRHGQITENKCRPCGLLSTKDVFGLLHKFGLPIHPAYVMTGGGMWPREYLRVASLGGHRGRGMGRYEWEQRYYGDELRRLGE